MKKTTSQLTQLILFTVCISLFLFNISLAQAAIKQNPSVTFKLIENKTDFQHYTAKIVLENLPYSGKWQLGFTSIRPILAIDPAEIVMPKQMGDFYLITFHIPPGNNSITFNIHGKGSIKKYTEAPLAYFLVADTDSDHPTILSLQNVTTQLLPWQSAENEISKNRKKNNTAIEGNPIKTALTTDTSLIVPLPVELQRHSGQFVLNEKTHILVADSDARGAVNFFRHAIQPVLGYKLKVSEYQDGQPLQNTILLTSENAEALLHGDQREEGYTLEVTPQTIIIHAFSASGFFYALQSLRELLPPEIFAKTKPSPAIVWRIPSVYIKDYPRFHYRGLHLDVVRHFMPVDQVKRLMDLMAIHKLNYFQWHLSDDEGWRVEIKKYPQLTAKGAWRGYDPTKHAADKYDLLPAFGSSAVPYGGYYTQSDIRDVVKYAQERHITIVPEIDLPGHARAMIMSLPAELIDTADDSVYTSIQGYHDNVLAPCKPSTFVVLNNIITEIASLFPGKYIHIGGDEVPHGVWRNSCMIKKYNPQDPKFRDEVQNDFLKQVQSMITNQGKIIAGWEEIANDSSTLTAPLLVYVWNTAKIDQVYEKSVQAGYKMIMAPAENLYFDLAYTADPKEPGQYWAGHVDTFSPYSFKPIDKGKGQSNAVIKGVQGQLWSEFIDSAERLDYLAFPKIAGLSELAWTLAERRNWKNFSDRMRYLHILRLENYGVGFRKIEFPVVNGTNKLK